MILGNIHYSLDFGFDCLSDATCKHGVPSPDIF